MKKKGIDLNLIIELHNQGFPPTQIGEKLGCTKTNVSKRLKKAGISPLIQAKARRVRRNRYVVDESYFENIDTNEKAYLLGLMYADGSVVKNGFYLKLKDEDILIKMKKELNAEQNVKYINYSGFDAYILTIYSQKIARDLISHGCFINKTHSIRFPKIKKEYYSHFIRGFYDGDGCLLIDDKRYHCQINLTSAAKGFLEDLRPIIAEMALTNGSLNKETTNNTWHLSFSGKQVNQILDWLYNDSTMFLNRKYNKFLIYKNVHIKSDKLLENQEIDNQQPIISLND